MDGRTDFFIETLEREANAEDYGNSCAAAATRYTPDAFLSPIVLVVVVHPSAVASSEERNLYLVTN